MATEKIKTDCPVMEDRLKITREIAEFWNKASEGFRVFWGPHIHHGYFEGRETPIEAQEKLIEKLTALLKISPQDKILDVGCGMGGSSLYLAKKYRVEVTGISLSQRQVDMATESARKERIDNVSFKVEDAQSLASFSDHAFDIIWSLESCEQFFDKKLFIQQAFRVLKPGGKLMLATWCSDSEEYEGVDAKKYKKLCTSFQLPYMPTINYYMTLLQKQGFEIDKVADWSVNVGDSWKIGLANASIHSIWKLFKASGWRALLFLRDARLMQKGFEERRVEYGVFSAQKPLMQEM